MRPHTTSPTKLAAKLLKVGRTGAELLQVRDFKTDEAQHDDDLHARVCAEFSAEVDRLKEELSKKYGKPWRTGSKDTRLVPGGGVVRYAVWRVGKMRLHVCAAREDREVPF